jgi:hypothetical protein
MDGSIFKLFPGTFGQRLQWLLWYLFVRSSMGRHC